jgi:hypothetical protein
VGLVKHDGEISLSPDSMDDVNDLEDSGSAADGPEKIRAKKRCEPTVPTRKRKLPNVISIASRWHMQANGREGDEQN